MSKTATATKRKGRALAFHKAAEVRRTQFDGIPIVDAKADFMLTVQTRDVDAARGNERDAANCVLANACKRQLHSSRVAFFRETAYVEMPDEKGRRVLKRFKLSAAAAGIVRAFDKGKQVSGEVTVTLNAPPPGQRLEHIRKASRKCKERRRQALLKGELFGKAANARYAKNPRIEDMDVRNGSGQVQNKLVSA